MLRLRRLAAIALLALAATLTQAPAQTPPGVLIVAQIAEPKSLDPHAVTAVNDFRILVNLYDGLVRYRSGTLEVEPALAESWEISEDGTVYTFHLRDGVTFHDGSPFDAEAVKFNFERMLDETHPYHDTGPFPLSFFFSAVDKVEAPDPQTVVFTLKEPYAPFLSNLAYPTGLIVSPAAVKEYGKDFGRHPSGTGPFHFVEWESNSRVVVEANPDYWDGPPELQAVVFRPITDANTRVAEMMSGGVDVMVEVPPDILKSFEQDPSFTVHEQAGPHLWFLILNTKDGPDGRQAGAPGGELRDRQAGAGRQRAAGHRRGRRRARRRRPSPGRTTTSLQPYPHDPDKARALLKEAGAEGAELTFYVTDGGSGMLDPVAMGAAIQADLAEVGLDVEDRDL